MMGRQERGQGQFFYSFDLDKVVPPDHLADGRSNHHYLCHQAAVEALLRAAARAVRYSRTARDASSAFGQAIG
jgi:hypothetical protein